MAVHVAVATDVFDGVLFCAVLFPTRCLGRDLELNWVSSWEFSYLLFLNISPLRARVGRPKTSWSSPVISLLAIPRRLFRFGALVILDGKLLFTWFCWRCLWWCLFVLSFFLGDVLDEIRNLIESVSEGFPIFSCIRYNGERGMTPGDPKSV